MKKHHEKCACATTAVKSHTSSDSNEPSTTKRSHSPSPPPAEPCAISASVTSLPKIDVVETSNFGVTHTKLHNRLGNETASNLVFCYRMLRGQNDIDVWMSFTISVYSVYTSMSFACICWICLVLNRIQSHVNTGLLDVFKPYYAVLYHFYTGMLKTYFIPLKTHPWWTRASVNWIGCMPIDRAFWIEWVHDCSHTSH